MSLPNPLHALIPNLGSITTVARFLGIGDPKQYAANALRAEIRKKLTARWAKPPVRARVLSSMAQETSLRDKIRTAEYFLWKAVFGSGRGSAQLSDAFRDAHDDRVVPAVTAHVTHGNATDADILDLTITAELDVLL